MYKVYKYPLIIVLFFFPLSDAKAQQIFYQDICHCGVTGAGFSTGQGSGSGSFNIYIEPGSAINKAFLFIQRFGDAKNTNITLNGNQYKFNSNNQVSSDYILPYTDSLSAVHAIDITSDINSAQTSYNITIPFQNNNSINVMYGNVYLYVIYEKPSLLKTATTVLLNNYDMIHQVENYSIQNLIPINTGSPVGFALYTDRLNSPSTTNDGSNLFLDNNNIGLTGGSMGVDSSWNSGSRGHFYYQNNQLFGLDDDIPNSNVGENDGLANISSYINNNTTGLEWKLIWENQYTFYNIYSGFFLTHTTSCDTFSTSLNTTDTALCRGDSVQLNVNGGNTSLSKDAYEWEPQRGLSCYNCPDPVASPDSSVTYRVRIWNTDSCSKVLPLRVRVQDAVSFSTEQEGFLCGESSGQITFNTGGNNESYEYQVNNTTQTLPVFSNLAPGNTLLKVTAANGCSAEKIVNIEGENDVTAAYTAQPPEGEAPLSVWLNNTSTNSNFYDWHIEDDTLNEENPGVSLDTIGVYPVKLIACKNEDQCCDTVQKNIVVQPEVSTFVPNIITPNGDGKNDRFRAEIKGAQEATLQIYNRWGNPLGQDQSKAKLTEEGYYLELYWNGQYQGQTAPDGVYTYTISYIDWRGKEQNKAGSFHLAQ